MTSGMERLGKTAQRLNLPLEAGSLFPEGQDIKIVYVVLFLPLLGGRRDIEKQVKTLAQIVAPVFILDSTVFAIFSLKLSQCKAPLTVLIFHLGSLTRLAQNKGECKKATDPVLRSSISNLTAFSI